MRRTVRDTQLMTRCMTPDMSLTQCHQTDTDRIVRKQLSSTTTSKYKHELMLQSCFCLRQARSEVTAAAAASSEPAAESISHSWLRKEGWGRREEAECEEGMRENLRAGKRIRRCLLLVQDLFSSQHLLPPHHWYCLPPPADVILPGPGRGSIGHAQTSTNISCPKYGLQSKSRFQDNPGKMLNSFIRSKLRFSILSNFSHEH